MSEQPSPQPERDAEEVNPTSETMSSPEAEAAAESVDAAANGTESTSGDDLAQLQQQLADAQNHVLRTQAELDNFRKRARRELDESLKYAQLPLMRDLVGVIDNFSLALQAAAQNEQAEELVAGVRMVSEQLQNVLKNHHCHPIDALGQPFDPNQHEAIQMEASDEYPANTVSREVRTGYRLFDRVIRPAQVFVSTGTPSDA